MTPGPGADPEVVQVCEGLDAPVSGAGWLPAGWVLPDRYPARRLMLGVDDTRPPGSPADSALAGQRVVTRSRRRGSHPSGAGCIARTPVASYSVGPGAPPLDESERATPARPALFILAGVIGLIVTMVAMRSHQFRDLASKYGQADEESLPADVTTSSTHATSGS